MSKDDSLLVKNYQIDGFCNWFSYSIPVRLDSSVQELMLSKNDQTSIGTFPIVCISQKIILNFFNQNALLCNVLYLAHCWLNPQEIIVTILPKEYLNLSSAVFTERHYLLELPFTINGELIYLDYCVNTLRPIHDRLNLAKIMPNELLISSSMYLRFTPEEIIDDSGLLKNFPQIIKVLKSSLELFNPIRFLTVLNS